MKKNGFLLNELLISFALSFIILLAIFNTTISLNQRLSDLYVENKASSQQIIFNRKIALDFANNELSKIEMNANKVFTLTYKNSDTTTMEFKNENNINYIKINDERINLDKKMTFKVPESINEIFTCTNLEEGRSLVSIKLPIKYLRKTNDYGIELYNITTESCSNLGFRI